MSLELVSALSLPLNLVRQIQLGSSAIFLLKPSAALAIILITTGVEGRNSSDKNKERRASLQTPGASRERRTKGGTCPSSSRTVRAAASGTLHPVHRSHAIAAYDAAFHLHLPTLVSHAMKLPARSRSSGT